MTEEEHSRPAPSGLISQPLVVTHHFLPTSSSQYIFRVRRRLPAHQFVCVSGNLPELGEWIPDKALCLVAKGENGEVNVWEFPLSLSHLEEVNYRYLVCSELKWRGEKKLIVEQFESTIHPRKFVSSSTAVKGSVPVVVEDGEFGTTRRGEHSVDEGWLEHVSELQLRLHSSTEPGVRLEGELKDEEIKIRVSTLCHQECKQLSSKMKVLDVTTGDCHLFEEEELVPYRCGCVVVFTARSPDFSNCAILVDIFSGKDGEFLGRSSISPQHLKDDGGRLTLTISNKELLPVGVMQCDYIIVHPLKCDLVHNTSKIFSKHWSRSRGCVDMGHRGMGCSLSLTPPHSNPPATENTIDSFEQAVANGSEFVELDVVMTADLVPVVYHDFEVCAKQMKSGTESVKPQTLRIHNLTHHQLRHLHLEHTNVLNCGEEDKGCFTLCNNHPNTPKKNIFPTLAQVCHSLPKNVGFNVDVKYPTPNADGQLEYSYFSRNQVADIIISTLYQHAGDRKIFLSCFDPDLCTMFRIKQPRYPVLYLTDTEVYPEESCADVRCRSLNAAISFALSESLLGVSAYCDMFISECSLVEAVHSRGLILFTWGEKNHFKENIELQRKAGVDAVINDRIPPEAIPSSPISISSGVEISFWADKEVELAWKERPLDFNTPSLSVIEVPVT